MPYCVSCGRNIPDGQGGSCSMCYGDVEYGSDGYYENYLMELQRYVEEPEPEKLKIAGVAQIEPAKAERAGSGPAPGDQKGKI